MLNYVESWVNKYFNMILWCRKLVSLFQYKNHTLLVYFCMGGIFSPHIYSHKPGSHLQLSETMTWREDCFFLMSMLLCWHFFVDSGNLALVWQCTKSMLVKLNLILNSYLLWFYTLYIMPRPLVTKLLKKVFKKGY